MTRLSGSPWFSTWAQQGFAGQSVRQVVRLNAGGTHLRIRLSNGYGAHRTLIRAAHAKDVKAVGATLLPFEGVPGWTREAGYLRRALND
ncbi:hypothetical protein HTZ77_33380 [Nonomuraea sp. SMC257]|uniref:Uncharacterized protein n=1 Tax=Nonomuraea montanisoli TaxID=2741721 RepID=A0A7Y6IDQ9_9ACTN|nr:hypothetical protein [Nonomuraea montanisoli]NUW36266.1 hypothetical protein [Nonomuraea montanisoli]